MKGGLAANGSNYPSGIISLRRYGACARVSYGKLARVIAVLPVLLRLEVERILVRPTPGMGSHVLYPAKAPALICSYEYALHKLSPF